MIPKVTQETIDLGDGRSITIETGKLAKQADGAVVVKLGNTMILATVVSNKEAKELLANEINKLLGNTDVDTLILKANNSLPVGSVINQLNLAKNSNAAREMVTRNVVFVDGVLATLETRINLNQTVSLKVGKKEPINVRLELKDEWWFIKRFI